MEGTRRRAAAAAAISSTENFHCSVAWSYFITPKTFRWKASSRILCFALVYNQRILSRRSAPTENAACNFKVLSKSGEETLVENGRASRYNELVRWIGLFSSVPSSLFLSWKQNHLFNRHSPSYFRIIFHPPNARLIGCFVTRFRDRLITRLVFFLLLVEIFPKNLLELQGAFS